MDGVLYEDELDVRSQLVLFYQGLYEETELGRPSMDGLDFACIEEEERQSNSNLLSLEHLATIIDCRQCTSLN